MQGCRWSQRQGSPTSPGPRTSRLPPQDAAIIDARLAATYTQLGFLGRAARYFQDDALMGKLADPEQRIEYLIAWSLHDFLSGDSASSLERVDRQPRSWPNGTAERLVSARARGGVPPCPAADRCRTLRRSTGGTRGLRNLLYGGHTRPARDPETDRGNTAGAAAAGGLPGPLRPSACDRHVRCRGHPGPSGDADGGRLADAAGLEYFAQRAYLEACFSARDAERCAPDAAMIFSLPYNVPFGIPTLLASQSVPIPAAICSGSDRCGRVSMDR